MGSQWISPVGVQTESGSGQKEVRVNIAPPAASSRSDELAKIKITETEKNKSWSEHGNGCRLEMTK